MRVAVIGARRSRDGTGPYLATFLTRAGADVRAVLGTSALTAQKAADDLRVATRHDTRPYHDAADLFENEALDALVIASPNETHAGYLQVALDRGLHVLCEKPLVWGGADPAGEAARIVRAFHAAGLVLRVNAQWPETLPTYRELHPRTPDLPTRFEMDLAPSSRGLAMVVDSLSHPLSLLAAIAPDPGARLGSVLVTAGEDAFSLRFVYATDLGEIDCRVGLRRVSHQPRPASYALDGRVAHRRVTLDPYALSFEGEGRTIPLPDPTPLLVRSFLTEAASPQAPTVDFAAQPGMTHLVTLVEAARKAAGIADETEDPRPA